MLQLTQAVRFITRLVMTTNQRILEGEYDFSRNVLRLSVSVSENGEEQGYVQWREFDVTSLKITRRSAANSRFTREGNLEVLGARTEQVMKTILPQLIETFKAMDPNAVDLLLSKSEHQEKPLKKRVSLRTEERRLRASAVEDSTPRTQVGHVAICSTQLEMQGNGQITHGNISEHTALIENPTVIKDILKAANWESMIRDVQGYEPENEPVVAPVDPNHQWTASARKSALRNTHEQLTHVLNYFHDQSGQLERIQTQLAEVRKPENALTTIGELSSCLDEVTRQFQEFAASHSSHIGADNYNQFTTQINELRKNIAKLKSKEERRLFQAQRFLSLYGEINLFLALRELNRQKFIDYGRAPIGSDITHDWDDLVSKYELVPPGNTPLADHLAKQFGLDNEGTSRDEVNQLRSQAREIFERAESAFREPVVMPPSGLEPSVDVDSVELDAQSAAFSQSEGEDQVTDTEGQGEPQEPTDTAQASPRRGFDIHRTLAEEAQARNSRQLNDTHEIVIELAPRGEEQSRSASPLLAPSSMASSSVDGNNRDSQVMEPVVLEDDTRLDGKVSGTPDHRDSVDATDSFVEVTNPDASDSDNDGDSFFDIDMQSLPADISLSGDEGDWEKTDAEAVREDRAEALTGLVGEGAVPAADTEVNKPAVEAQATMSKDTHQRISNAEQSARMEKNNALMQAVLGEGLTAENVDGDLILRSMAIRV